MFQTDYPIEFNPKRASLEDLRKFVADVVGVVVCSISTPDHQTEHVLNVMKILCAVCGRQHWLLTDAIRIMDCTGSNISLQFANSDYSQYMFPTGDHYDTHSMTPTRIALNSWNSGARLHWLMAGSVTLADPESDTAMMVTLKNALDDIEGDIWTSGVLSHFPYVKATEYNPGLLLQSPKPSFQKMSEAAAPLDELVNFQRFSIREKRSYTKFST